MRFRHAAKKAHLVAGDTEKRLNYARSFNNWPNNQWKNVVCMDEKRFSTEKDGKFHVVITHLIVIKKIHT